MAEREPTVIVIDDDAAVRTSLQRLLRASGFRAEAHADAGSYLGRTAHDGPGCIILDVGMPGLDGMELQQQMNDRGDDLPIVFLTGHGDIPTSVAAIKAGAEDFLIKPVDEPVLLRAVRSALARHASRRSDARHRHAVRAHIEALTPREQVVMRCVIGGALNKQIAARLDIAEKTVKAHRGQVMRKMEVRSVAELVHACIIADVEPESPV